MDRARPTQSLRQLVNADDSTIPDVFSARARSSPDKIFLLWGDRNWSYRDSLEQIEGFAGFLRALDVGSGVPRVASYLNNCPEALWTWLGTMFAGGIMIPLNRQHKGLLLADMLQRSTADVLVTDTSALDNLPDLDPHIPLTIVVTDDDLSGSSSGLLSFQKCLNKQSFKRVDLQPTDQACVLFTSGTTGRSKAVRIPHNQYCRGGARLVDAFELHCDDVFHNWLPLYHLGGQLHMTMTAIIAGGTVALLPTFSGSSFWSEVESYKVSVLCGFATILHLLWSLPERQDESNASLRIGIFAGIPKDLHQAFENRFGMALRENYGMTEADPITHPQPGLTTPPMSCGPAGDDFEIAILDNQDEKLPPSTVGEIAIRARAPGVMALGYERDESATREAFRGGWFHTGDFGMLDEQGFLYFKGRGSNYIRRRGENVSVSELESIILTHPDVEECAAIAVPSDLGEDDIKLAVAVRKDCCLSPGEVYQYAADRMAAFMVPRYIEIFPELPRGDVGKVTLADLKDIGPMVWDAQLRK